MACIVITKRAGVVQSAPDIPQMGLLGALLLVAFAPLYLAAFVVLAVGHVILAFAVPLFLPASALYVALFGHTPSIATPDTAAPGLPTRDEEADNADR